MYYTHIHVCMSQYKYIEKASRKRYILEAGGGLNETKSKRREDIGFLCIKI